MITATFVLHRPPVLPSVVSGVLRPTVLLHSFDIPFRRLPLLCVTRDRPTQHCRLVSSRLVPSHDPIPCGLVPCRCVSSRCVSSRCVSSRVSWGLLRVSDERRYTEIGTTPPPRRLRRRSSGKRNRPGKHARCLAAALGSSPWHKLLTGGEEEEGVTRRRSRHSTHCSLLWRYTFPRGLVTSRVGWRCEGADHCRARSSSHCTN